MSYFQTYKILHHHGVNKPVNVAFPTKATGVPREEQLTHQVRRDGRGVVSRVNGARHVWGFHDLFTAIHRLAHIRINSA